MRPLRAILTDNDSPMEFEFSDISLSWMVSKILYDELTIVIIVLAGMVDMSGVRVLILVQRW